MYPFNSNSHKNTTSLDAEFIQHTPYLVNSQINPSETFEETRATSLFNFTSPCMRHIDELNEQTRTQLQDLLFKLRPLTTADNPASNMGDAKRASSVNELKTETSRKRTSKKDRHSKILTAHGLRDRRVRLSLDVAKRFFDLQDMLGFDKASKTVEWMLIKSNSAIKEIKKSPWNTCNGGANSISLASDGDVISGTDESNTNENQQPSINKKIKQKSNVKKDNKAEVVRRIAVDRLAQESRKIARERARRRTLEKRKLGEGLKACSHFETGEESGTAKIQLKQVEEFRAHDQRLLGHKQYAADGDSLLITGNWIPSSICFCQNNAEISQEICEKPWGHCDKMKLWDNS